MAIFLRQRPEVLEHIEDGLAKSRGTRAPKSAARACKLGILDRHAQASNNRPPPAGPRPNFCQSVPTLA